MSYDLLFKPRNGLLDQADLVRYFSHRHNYKVDGAQAIYGNEDTGVYFQFDSQTASEASDTEDYPVAFNINYFRPSYFILEAEMEVSAFVRTFDALVSDGQIGGMGEGEYRSDLLVSGWNVGNLFAYSAFLREPSSARDLLSLPTKVLMRVWEWNRDRKTLQQQVGERQFVPRIMMIHRGGMPATVAVWPDAIPSILPLVEYLIIVRQELAPKRFFKPVPDSTLLPWGDAMAMLARHASPLQADGLSLGYDRPPRDVIKFVRSLPASKQEIVGVAADKVLDRELVENALT